MYAEAIILGNILRNTGGFVGIVILILQITVIISVLAGQGSTTHKILWTLVILLLPVLGLVLYAIFGRSSRDRSLPA